MKIFVIFHILKKLNINRVLNQERNVFTQIMIYNVTNIIDYFNTAGIFMNKRLILSLDATLSKYVKSFNNDSLCMDNIQ